MVHTLWSSKEVSMQGNEFHGMLPILVSLQHLHQIHIKNEQPCQFQTSGVKLDIWKLSLYGFDFLSQLVLHKNQQDSGPTVQGGLYFDATFEEEEHQPLVFWKQIAEHGNYICIEVSR